MFYVYILKSKQDNKLYIGFTNNLRRRFLEHNNGLVRATKSRRPLELVYYEAYKNRQDAKIRESNLKRYSNAYIQLKLRISRSVLV